MREREDGTWDCGNATHEHMTHESAAACIQQRSENALQEKAPEG